MYFLNISRFTHKILNIFFKNSSSSSEWNFAADRLTLKLVSNEMQSIVLSARALSQKKRVARNREIPNLIDLERHIKENSKQIYLSEQIFHCIEKDSDNLFKKTYLGKNLLANFQTIALAKLSGKTWQEIATELEIDIITLSSFFQNCCNNYANLVREELLESEIG